VTVAEVLLGLRQLRAQGSADPRAVAMLVREIERLNGRISRLVGLPHQFVSVAPLQKSLAVLVKVLRGSGKATPGELRAAEAPLEELWQSLASLEGPIQIEAPARTPRTKKPIASPDRATIEEALRRARGDVAHAARLLKTRPRTLLAWMKPLKITIGRFRSN
jgi:transcriptional regulator with GAF, ATPase, and Fis domain